MARGARSAAIAAFLLAVVAAVATVASVAVRLRGRENAAPEPRGAPVLRIDAARAVALHVAAGGDDVRLVRDARGWRIVSPTPADADPAAVAALLDALVRTPRRATAAPAGEPPSELRYYGLDAPRERIEVTLEGGRIERLALGNDTGTDGVLFVMTTSGEVVEVPQSARAALAKRLSDLRARAPAVPGSPAPLPAASPAPPRTGG